MNEDRVYREKAGRVADFDFDRETAEVFDDMLERSVPFYNETQQMIADFAEIFAQDGTCIYDLGCSTGTTLLGIGKVLAGRDIRLVGVDWSEDMLIKAKEKLETNGLGGRCELIRSDLNRNMSLEPASMVVMNLMLQFIRPLYRDRLIQNIYEALVNKGCLIFVEKVLVSDSLLSRLYIDLHYRFKQRKGYSKLEISRKREALENVLVPYRVTENIELLTRNGFKTVDLFFQWYNFAGFIAVKA